MSRTHYRNGDPIDLQGEGCNSCHPLGVAAGGLAVDILHEVGCPDAWRDYSIPCKWCGTYFYPTNRNQVCCDSDCARQYQGG